VLVTGSRRLKFLVAVITACILIFIWFFEIHSAFVSEELPLQPLNSSLSKEELIVHVGCFGVLGACKYDDIDVVVRLQFSGVIFKMPAFLRQSLTSNTGGWQYRNYYFGDRTLTIQTKNKTYSFKQKLWNVWYVRDLMDLIILQSKEKAILVFPNPTPSVPGAPVGYSVPF